MTSRKRPDPQAFLESLRALSPGAEYPVVGREAIRQWFYDHGFRGKRGGAPAWRTLLDWQRQAGEPLAIHVPEARRTGVPMSTHMILLRWCFCQLRGPDWKPSPRFERLKRQLGRDLAASSTR